MRLSLLIEILPSSDQIQVLHANLDMLVFSLHVTPMIQRRFQTFGKHLTRQRRMLIRIHRVVLVSTSMTRRSNRLSSEGPRSRASIAAPRILVPRSAARSGMVNLRVRSTSSLIRRRRFNLRDPRVEVVSGQEIDRQRSRRWIRDMLSRRLWMVSRLWNHRVVRSSLRRNGRIHSDRRRSLLHRHDRFLLGSGLARL